MVGRLGEAVAERFLTDRGGRLLGRNVVVDRGEVDLHMRLAGSVVAVEVKTLVDGSHTLDPADHFTEAKADQVWRLARLLDPPAHRVDLVTVVLSGGGASVRWIKHA
jgi:Holliday junction resolvase-like predicted endonuclease